MSERTVPLARVRNSSVISMDKPTKIAERIIVDLSQVTHLNEQSPSMGNILASAFSARNGIRVFDCRTLKCTMYIFKINYVVFV